MPVNPSKANKFILLLLIYPVNVLSAGLYKCSHIKVSNGPPWKPITVAIKSKFGKYAA